MALEIKIPAVGESITEVTIAKWLKKDGEAVQRDEVIAELESYKATFELPAEAAGTLKIRVAEGETIGIGTVIAELDGAGAPASNGQAAAPAAGGDALAKGGTSFDSLYVNVNGESGYFDRSLDAYGREGESCRRCGAVMHRERFMNRSSFYCPKCQPRPRR